MTNIGDNGITSGMTGSADTAEIGGNTAKEDGSGDMGLDRAALVAALERIGAAEDAEALAAAREADRLIKQAGFTWDEMLVDATDDSEDDPLDAELHDDPDEGDWEETAPAPKVLGETGTDRERIERLLARPNLNADTRQELKDLRDDLDEGAFSARDRKYLTSLEERLSRSGGKRK